MNKKLFSILILTLTVIGLGLAYKYHFAIKPNPNELKIYGNVEIRQAYLGFKVAGRIAKLNYMEGDYVKKGDLLAKLETISYEAEKKNKKDIALIYSEVPATAAGTFTTNRVKAAPVLVDIDSVKKGKGQERRCR